MNSLKKLALLCALLFSIPALAQTAVSGTKVQDGTGTGSLLPSGNWCFASTCIPVTNGAFSGTVTAGTQTVTVVNASSVTVLTVPGVVVGSSAFSWDTYVVPGGANIAGRGAPLIACQVGAIYTQVDSIPANAVWTCTGNGQVQWSKGAPNPGPNNVANAVASEIPVTSNATPTFGNLANSTYMVLTSNVTSWTVAPGLPGQTARITFCENSAGGFTLAAAPANVQNWPGLQSTAANACTTVDMTYNSAAMAWIAGTAAVSFSGDISGTRASQLVKGFNGLPLCSSTAVANQVYQFNGTCWNPVSISTGSPGGATGTIQVNSSGAFGAATAPQIATAVTNSVDDSTIINTSPYTPYTLGSGNTGNIFISTGALAYGSGTVGSFTGNNIAMGLGAMASAVNPGSLICIGVDACNAENGNGNADPGAGNGVVIGANAGMDDPSMSDFVLIGQKAYTDANPGSVGGLSGSVVIGVHTDGIDGWGASVAIGEGVVRSTNGQPVTGANNTVVGADNFNCVTCTTAPTAPTSINNATVFGFENMASDAFGSNFAVAIGTSNLNKFTAGSITAGTVTSSIAVGNNNLEQDVTGINNVAVGNNVLDSTTSSSNTGVGDGTCSETTTGNCTAFGLSAAGFNTTGTVTAFGENASGHGTGTGIDAFGVSACFNTTGANNVCIGDSSGESSAGATSDVFIGVGSGNAETSADNVWIGRNAGAAGSAGNNVGIGEVATCTACSSSEMIGQGATISGTVTGSAQIGAGSNTTNNTMQFRSANFLTSANLITPAGYGQTAANSTAGTCTMTATTCTVTLGHTYTTPICLVTQQGTTAPTAMAACSVSGATATVTASASNAATWGVFVFGNPN